MSAARVIVAPIDTTLIAGDVRARQRAAGLSQIELAERAGCSWSTIRLFDRGYTPAHSETLSRVLAVLDEIEDDVPLEAA